MRDKKIFTKEIWSKAGCFSEQAKGNGIFASRQIRCIQHDNEHTKESVGE